MSAARVESARRNWERAFAAAVLYEGTADGRKYRAALGRMTRYEREYYCAVAGVGYDGRQQVSA